MKKNYLFIFLILLFYTHQSNAKGRYDSPSKFPFGIYGGIGMTTPLSSPPEKNNNLKLSYTFPPSLGIFGGYRIADFMEIRPCLYWDMITMNLNSSNKDFSLKWRKHNINSTFNFNFFINKNIHQFYLLCGFDIYYTLKYNYKAENPGNIPSNFTIYSKFKDIDKVESLYEKNNNLNKLGGGINLGAGFIFDFGLVVEYSVNLDITTFSMLSKDTNFKDKGPEAEEFNKLINFDSKSMMKLKVGYDLSNLLP